MAGPRPSGAGGPQVMPVIVCLPSSSWPRSSSPRCSPRSAVPITARSAATIPEQCSRKGSPSAAWTPFTRRYVTWSSGTASGGRKISDKLGRLQYRSESGVRECRPDYSRPPGGNRRTVAAICPRRARARTGPACAPATEASVCMKRSKIRSRMSFDIPRPLSRTVTIALPFSRAHSSVIAPPG